MPPPSFSALVNSFSFTDFTPAEPLTIHGLLLCDRGVTAEVGELEEDRTGQDRTGQDKTGQDRTGEESR